MPRVRQAFSVVVLVVTIAVGCRALSRHSSRLSAAHTEKDPGGLDSYNILPGGPRAEPSGSSHRRTYPINDKRALPSTHKIQIVAVGDIHADYTNFIHVLQMAGVVDVNENWSGIVDYLVQTGDIIDRGVDTIEIFEYMETLRGQAEAVGGAVVSLLGNHEYDNLILPWNADVSEIEIATFGGSIARRTKLTVGSIGESWRMNYQVACRLPLHPSVGSLNQDYSGDESSPLSHAAISFVHGGLSPTFPELTPFPSHINHVGYLALTRLQVAVTQETQARLTYKEERLIRSNGPLWYRGWAQDKDEAAVCARVDDVLKKTGTRRMVMGHSVQLHGKGILRRCGGKILVIDTGISSHYERLGGRRSALHIEYRLTPNPEVAESADQQTWTEKEVITAIYDETEDIIAEETNVITGDFALSPL